MNRKSFKELVGSDWFDILNEVINKEVEFNLDKIKSLYMTSKVYPEGSKIFRAFQECELNNLKIVWLGLEPYINGEAEGLAFSCYGSKMTPSFYHILKAYDDCYPMHFNTDMMEGNLLPWAKQGVLLLNTSLTVEAGKTESHAEYWKEFTQRLIKELDINYKDLIFVGFGSVAGEFLKDVRNVKIIREHPAYAAKMNRPWKHDMLFHELDNKLKELKLEEIKW